MTTFETEVCSRCGGSGHYSYCSMYGTTCFGCGGSGKKYTKRGTAALAYLKSLRCKPARDFKVGELMYMEAGPLNKGGFCRIKSITLLTGAEKHARGFRSMRDGVEQPQRDTLDFEFEDGAVMGGYGGVGMDNPLRPGLTAEEKQRTLKLALEYQDTLTKQGKPMKRRKACVTQA